jgi:hypothetical protein
MQPAVFMVPVPTAVEMVPIRVAVHVPVVVIIVASWIVHLAVLMIPMSGAIEMPAMGIAMHVSVMMAVAIVARDVSVMGLLHDPILRCKIGTDRRGLGGCCRERQRETCSQERQRFPRSHGCSPDRPMGL